MEPPPHQPPSIAVGEHSTTYQNHGFATSASPTTNASSFRCEASPPPHDVDSNNEHDDDDIRVRRDAPAQPEIETAYSEARARGLPDGWTCSIDVC